MSLFSSSDSKYEHVLEEIYQSTITMLKKTKPHLKDDLLKFVAQDLIRVATKRLTDSRNGNETGVLNTLNDILQRRFPSQTNDDQPKSPKATTPPKEQDETSKNQKRKCGESAKCCGSDSAYNSRSSSRQSGFINQEKNDNKFKLYQNRSDGHRNLKRNNSSCSLKSNGSSLSQRKLSVCSKPELSNLKTSREGLFGSSPLTALDVFRYKQLEKRVKLSQERRQAEGNVFERLYRDSQKPKSAMTKRKEPRIQEIRRPSDRYTITDQNTSVSTESVIQLELAINHLSIKHNN